MKNYLTHFNTTHVKSPYSVFKFKLLQVLLAVLFLFLLNLAPVWAQPTTWIAKTTNTLQKTSVISDAEGNSYLLAAFSGTTTFGQQSFTSLGATDLVLVKYNPSGTVVWARRIGGKGEELVGGVSFYQNGKTVLITGSFQSTVKFENYSGQTSPPSLLSKGGSDVLLAQYDSKFGYLLWTRGTGGTGHDYGQDVAVDKSGNAFVTGSFSGKIILSSSVLTEQSLISNGSSDVLLLKYSPDGKRVFAQKLGGKGYDTGTAIALDPNTSDVYLTGGYSPDGQPYISNILVAKFSGQGTKAWHKIYGSSTSIDIGADILFNDDFNINIREVHVTGYFGGSVNFDGTTLVSNGSADAFRIIFKAAEDGKATYAMGLGGKGWDEGQSLVSDGLDVYLSGSFTGTATIGYKTLTALGGATDRDIFLFRFSTFRGPAWTRQMGSVGMDYQSSLYLANTNMLFYTLSHGQPITLDNTTINGSGSILSKVILPTVDHLKLYNAAADTLLQQLPYYPIINYKTIGTNQINIVAQLVGASAGSVKFILDEKIEWIDNGAAPFSYPGDAPKTGGTDYFPFTPSDGRHRLQVIPYSGPNGSGWQGVGLYAYIMIEDNPEVKSLTLVNALTDKDIVLLSNWYLINLATIGTQQVNIRANTSSLPKVGSVKFGLYTNGKLVKETMDNTVPYTLAGDVPRSDGSTDYLPITLSSGIPYVVQVTAYSGSNGTGVVGKTYEIRFSQLASNARLASEEEASEEPYLFKAAPNPFQDQTTLSFTPMSSGAATVEVYSAQGILIGKLFEGELESGKNYMWNLSAGSLAPGLYIARVSLDQRVFQQKLILNR